MGLGLYHGAPLLALAIELVLALACVAWFVRGSRLSMPKKIGLFATVVAGVAVMLPGAL